jgi:ribosomal protein S18 acetylase RimI-like enzyme
MPRRSRPARRAGGSACAEPYGFHGGSTGRTVSRVGGLAAHLIEPKRDQILRFCARDPVERVFLEDVARRGLGRFVAHGEDGELSALCHLGINAVPSGAACSAFARDVVRSGPRMLIGEQGAVSELWDEVRPRLPQPREDRPGQPVYEIRTPPPPGDTGLRPAEPGDLDLLMPACAAAHEQEIGVDPLQRDADGFRWRTRSQIEDGRSWLWVEDGVILFKAEASAWTPSAVQLQQVWVDPAVRRRGYGARGLSDLCRLLLERVPTVCLFVRAENDPAIRLYDAIGMEHVLDYRSLLF